MTEVPEQFNLAVALLDEPVKRGLGGKVAIRYEGRDYTYRQVQEAANRLGNALNNLGVEIEDRVLLLLLDGPEFAWGFFGAIKVGAVAVPVNTLLTPKDYEYLLNDCRAKVAIASEALAPQIEAARPRLKYLRHLVVAGRAGPGQLALDELMACASHELEAVETSKDDAAFWQYSSGTTGFPKGVIHLHHDMIYSADLFARNVLGLREDDRHFSVAKLFFGYGLGNGLCFPFRNGATTVYHPGRPEPEKILEIITRERPTVFFGVPTAYAAMLQIPDVNHKYDLSSVRLCVSAGEALPKAVFDRWKETFGLEIIDGIGTTEALHIFISNRPGQAKAGSSGTPVPGYEVKVVDEEGNQVPPGEVGNLMVKGDSIAAGYWNQHAKTKAAFAGEWLKTGDKYIQDNEGYFWFVGRGDDMLKVGGIWVSPLEVENAILAHPAVAECGVIGAEDADKLVKPLAFVVLRQGFDAGPELEAGLKQFVKSSIAPYKYPRWIRFVQEIPKTATGKLQRFKLRGLTG